MREIKFRGYNRKNNQWLYGFYLQNRGAHFVAPDEFATDKSWDDYEVDPETVGQFTGLTDKNGKEIYEGDIIESNKARHLVEYQDKESSFMGVNPNYGKDMLSGDDFSTPLRAWWIKKFGKVIIGNNHDNPELLK